MFQQPLEGASSALAALKKSLKFNLSLRKGIGSAEVALPEGFVQPPPFDEWRRLDHSTMLSRLYLIYESLVHECSSEWLQSLSGLVPYSDLPEKVKATHRDGLGYILQNLGGRRFSTISVGNLIKEYNESLSGTANHLHTDAFLLHDRNLRLEDLQQLVGNCGLDISLGEWLKNHRFLKNAEFLEIIGHSTIEKAISSLVDLRNEASHATRQLGEILGEEVLMAYADFIEALCRALVEGFTHAALKWHVSHGAWASAGRINLVLKDDSKICVAPLEACRLRTGALIYIQGKSYCFDATVLNIRIGGMDVTEHTSTKPVELGLSLSVDVAKHGEIYIKTEDLYKSAAVLPAALDITSGAGAAEVAPPSSPDKVAIASTTELPEGGEAPSVGAKNKNEGAVQTVTNATDTPDVAVGAEKARLSNAMTPYPEKNPKLLDDEDQTVEDESDDNS